MKRLAIITVGKTHSGKTTFARKLEKALENSLVMDQDNHAQFINTYYNKLQPQQGPNTLKHAISQFIVDYAKDNTNFHLIICNSNRSKMDCQYLLEDLFPKEKFIRILVHFDIPHDILQTRVINTKRSTNIFRSASSFKQVLARQQSDSHKEDIVNPVEGEADYLFIIKDNKEEASIMEEIIHFTKDGGYET